MKPNNVKLKVKYVGGANPASHSEVWGGSKATFNAFTKSFENDPGVDLIYRDRTAFINNGKFNVDLFTEFTKDADIVHVDDTGIVEFVYKSGLPAPDVIGPIARSPIKPYGNGWQSAYPKEWFYQSSVVRLNYSEERQAYIDKEFDTPIDKSELITLIHHGIDTNELKPANNLNRKYVLWAGMIPRYAKNYELMEEIMKITTLPDGFEWKVMSNYNVEDYWNTLDETAILINTSRYESFCNALFEARAKGVATIQPILLNGEDVHVNAPGQVEYNPESYREMILHLLTSDNYVKAGVENREYCVNTASLKIMRDSFYTVYAKIHEGKSL